MVAQKLEREIYEQIYLGLPRTALSPIVERPSKTKLASTKFIPWWRETQVVSCDPYWKGAGYSCLEICSEILSLPHEVM